MYPYTLSCQCNGGTGWVRNSVRVHQSSCLLYIGKKECRAHLTMHCPQAVLCSAIIQLSYRLTQTAWLGGRGDVIKGYGHESQQGPCWVVDMPKGVLPLFCMRRSVSVQWVCLACYTACLVWSSKSSSQL